MVLVLFIHFATIILEVQGGTENVFDARINHQTSCRRRKTGIIRGFMQQYCHFQCIILVMPIDGSCRPTRQTQLLFKKATTMAPVRAASSDISHQNQHRSAQRYSSTSNLEYFPLWHCHHYRRSNHHRHQRTQPNCRMVSIIKFMYSQIYNL